MTKEINKRQNYFIKIKILTKELEFKALKTQKKTKRPRMAPSAHLRPFTMIIYDIYKLILGLVSRVRSIALWVCSITLKNAFPVLMGACVLDRTLCALKRTTFRFSELL